MVGHVVLDGRWVRSASGDRPIVMLSPLPVIPGRKGHGIGTALIEAAARAAEMAAELLIALEGSPTFYGERGFIFARDQGLELPIPGWTPVQAVQVKLLTTYDPDAPTLRGTGRKYRVCCKGVTLLT